jgi:hypothetical protein
MWSRRWGGRWGRAAEGDVVLPLQLQTELGRSQPTAQLTAAARTGHSAFDIEKELLTLETGRSQLISGELAYNDRFHQESDAPDPLQSADWPERQSLIVKLTGTLRPHVASCQSRPIC